MKMKYIYSNKIIYEFRAWKIYEHGNIFIIEFLIIIFSLIIIHVLDENCNKEYVQREFLVNNLKTYLKARNTSRNTNSLILLL